MKYWLAVNVENINKYYVIEVQIVKKLKFESVWEFTVLLIIVIVLSELLNYFFIDIIT